MPQFGSYTDGSPGVAGDEIIAKRGTGTSVRLPLSALPVPSGAVPRTEYDTFVENTNSSLSSKQGALSVTGLASLNGNTLHVSQAEIAGHILDGKSTWCVPTNGNTFSTFGQTANAMTVTGTYAAITPNNPTNTWNERNRCSITSTAAINSIAGVRYGPRMRLPQTETATGGGYKFVATYACADSVTAASAIGIFQNTPTGGTQPSVYSGGRLYFYHDKGDTTWKFANGSTVLATFNSTDFPVNGNLTAPLQFEIEIAPAPSFAVYWKIKNLLTTVEASGSSTSVTLSTAYTPHLQIYRDTIDGTTSVVFETTGMVTGAFSAFTVGDPNEALVTPVTLTGATSVTRLLHANRDIFCNSASPFTITIPATGFNPGDYIYGVNRGAGAVSIAGSGHTIAAHADVPATVDQYAGFSVLCIDNGNWIRLT